MGFVDRGGGRESKGRSLRRSKKNPGAAAARTRPSTNAANTGDNDGSRRIQPPTPPQACVAALERFLTLRHAFNTQTHPWLAMSSAPVRTKLKDAEQRRGGVSSLCVHASQAECDADESRPMTDGEMNASQCADTHAAKTSCRESNTDDNSNHDTDSVWEECAARALSVYVRAACSLRSASMVKGTWLDATNPVAGAANTTQANRSSNGTSKTRDNSAIDSCGEVASLSPCYMDSCVSILSRKLQEDIPGVLRRAYEEAGVTVLLCWSSVQSRQGALVEFCRSYNNVANNNTNNGDMSGEEGKEEVENGDNDSNSLAEGTTGCKTSETESNTSEARRVHFGLDTQDNCVQARSSKQSAPTARTSTQSSSSSNIANTTTTATAKAHSTTRAASKTILHHDAMIDGSAGYSQCSLYCLVGVHVDSVDRTHHKVHEQWMSEIRSLATQPGVLGILSGLDLSRDAATHFSQELLLKESWRVAGERQLPLVLHIQCSAHSAERAAELLHELLKECCSMQEQNDEPRSVGHATSNDANSNDNTHNNSSTRNNLSAAAGPTALVLYDGINVLAHSVALQQLVHAHRPTYGLDNTHVLHSFVSATTPTTTTSPAGAYVPFYLMLSSSGLSTTSPQARAQGSEDAAVCAPRQCLWQTMMRGKADIDNHDGCNSSVADSVRSCPPALLTQLIIGSDAPWHTPQNIPDSYLREQSNEPANMPYTVALLYDTLREADSCSPSTRIRPNAGQHACGEDKKAANATDESKVEQRRSGRALCRDSTSVVDSEAGLLTCMTESKLSDVLFVNAMHVFFPATVSQMQSRLMRHNGRAHHSGGNVGAGLSPTDDHRRPRRDSCHDEARPCADADRDIANEQASSTLEKTRDEGYRAAVSHARDDVDCCDAFTHAGAPHPKCARSIEPHVSDGSSGSRQTVRRDSASQGTGETSSAAVRPCEDGSERATRDELQTLLRAAAQERERLVAEQCTREAAREAAVAAEKLRQLEESRRKRKKNVKANNRSNFTHFRNKNFAPRHVEGVDSSGSVSAAQDKNPARQDSPDSVRRRDRHASGGCDRGAHSDEEEEEVYCCDEEDGLVQDEQYQDLQLMRRSGSNSSSRSDDEVAHKRTGDMPRAMTDETEREEEDTTMRCKAMAMTRAQRKKKNKAIRQQRQRQGSLDDSEDE